jgi:hypothetical protein
MRILMRRLFSICLIFLLVKSTLQAQSNQKAWCAANGNSEPKGTPVSLNGSRAIDYAFRTDSNELSKLFAVYPAIFYMQESGLSNASAIWKTYPDLLAGEGSNPLCCPDGTVFLGIKLIKAEWQATQGSGLSLPAIEAHEFAHIAQFKYGSRLQGKWRELHADYLAGWFIGHRSRFPQIPTNVYQAMKNFYFKGADFGNHGTSEEREAAFQAGFQLNRWCNVASGWQAYQHGEAYILGL